MTKKCKTCQKEKDIELFERAYPKNNPSNLRRSVCTECRAVYHKKYRDDNRELMRTKDRNKYWSMDISDRQDHIKKKSQQNCNRIGIKEIRRKYNQSDIGIFNRYKNDSNRRYRKYEFSLTLAEFSALIHQKCHYCGISECKGVDRVDNTLGYITTNCVPCCKFCNQMKMDLTIDDFIGQCTKIVNEYKEKTIKKAKA
jgi:hypothetical protein